MRVYRLMLAVNGHAALVSLSYHSIKVIPFCFQNYYFFFFLSKSIRESCLKNKENKITRCIINSNTAKFQRFILITPLLHTICTQTVAISINLLPIIHFLVNNCIEFIFFRKNAKNNKS